MQICCFLFGNQALHDAMLWNSFATLHHLDKCHAQQVFRRFQGTFGEFKQNHITDNPQLNTFQHQQYKGRWHVNTQAPHPLQTLPPNSYAAKGLWHSHHENRSAKDNKTVTFAASERPLNDLVPDGTQCDSWTISRRKRGSTTIILTNKDTKNK